MTDAWRKPSISWTVVCYYKYWTERVIDEAWRQERHQATVFGDPDFVPIEYTPLALPWGDVGGITACTMVSPERSRKEIQLTLPTQGAGRSGNPGVSAYETFLCGVLVHEHVHVLQKLLDPEFTARTSDEQGRWRSEWWGRRDPTPLEVIRHYFSDPLEQGAHGVQAAVEMTLDDVPFDQTGVARHIIRHLRGTALPASLDAKIRHVAERQAVLWQRERAAAERAARNKRV